MKWVSSTVACRKIGINVWYPSYSHLMGIMRMNSMDLVEGYPKTHRQIQDMFRFRSDGLAPARGNSDSGACGRTFADLWSDWTIPCRLCIAEISMLYWSISVQLEICWCRHRISQAIPAVSAKSECQTSRFRGKLNQYSHTAHTSILNRYQDLGPTITILLRGLKSCSQLSFFVVDLRPLSKVCMLMSWQKCQGPIQNAPWNIPW